MPGLSRRSVGYLSRCTIHTALETRITETALTTIGHFLALTRIGQITEQLARIHIVHNRPARNPDLEVIAGFAGLVSSGTTLTAFCLEFAADAKIRQRVERRIRNKVDTSSIAAVATVGPASFNVFFTAKAKATVTTVARENANRCFIDEFHLCASLCDLK